MARVKAKFKIDSVIEIIKEPVAQTGKQTGDTHKTPTTYFGRVTAIVQRTEGFAYEINARSGFIAEESIIGSYNKTKIRSTKPLRKTRTAAPTRAATATTAKKTDTPSAEA